MIPYYDSEGITIYHADYRDVVPTLNPVDLVLTDPPYADETHSGARSHSSLGESFIDFPSIDGASWMADIEPLVSRWVVATMDWRHITQVAAAPPTGLRFVRFGVWVKPNGAPQFTGDRPGPGWEGIAFLHREGGRMTWHGGGRSSVFTVPRVNGEYPTEKPKALIRELIGLFSNPGDTVLDTFMGSGTTLRAAKDMGRRAIGIDINERACEIAVRRLQQSVLPLGV